MKTNIPGHSDVGHPDPWDNHTHVVGSNRLVRDPQNLHLMINGSPTVNHRSTASHDKWVSNGRSSLFKFPHSYIIRQTSFITGDLKIINNTSLRDMSARGPKYCERTSINCRHNFKHIMDSVEDYAGNGQNMKKRKYIVF
jgi:hypothetical protein